MSLPATLFTSSRLTVFKVSLALGDGVATREGCAQIDETVKTQSPAAKQISFIFLSIFNPDQIGKVFCNRLWTIRTKSKRRADQVLRASCYYSCVEPWRSNGRFIKSKKVGREFLKNRKTVLVMFDFCLPSRRSTRFRPNIFLLRIAFQFSLFGQSLPLFNILSSSSIVPTITARQKYCWCNRKTDRWIHCGCSQTPVPVRNPRA